MDVEDEEMEVCSNSGDEQDQDDQEMELKSSRLIKKEDLFLQSSPLHTMIMLDDYNIGTLLIAQGPGLILYSSKDEQKREINTKTFPCSQQLFSNQDSITGK